jgi:hypothetical protein
MKNLFISTFAIALLFVAASFTFEDTITIRITSPGTKSVYQPKDTIWLKGSASSTGALHDVSLKVISLKDSSVLFAKTIHSHSTSLNFNEYFINPVLDKSDLKFIVSTKGHDGRTAASQEQVFKCAAGKKK